MNVDATNGNSTVATIASNTASAAATNSASSDQTALFDNYEMFLELLTVQLQNQNPLEPMDADKFAEQLTQYSSVEQQIKTNQNLEQMLQTMSASNTGAIVGYIGKEIEASGAKTVFDGNSSTWTYDVSRDANATITIRNEAGAVIHTDQVALTAGGGSYKWDGQSLSGGNAPAGEYTISIEATDTAGASVPVTTNITGVVDEVDLSGTEAVLKIGNVRVPIGSVTAIRESSSLF